MPGRRPATTSLPSSVERSRGQSGAGLIEVLVATAVMVPLILAASMGLMTAIKASGSAEAAQKAQVALTTATENIKAMPYLDCGTADDYQKLYRTWSDELAPEIREEARSKGPAIKAVEYWDEGSASYVSDCKVDGGAQRFSITTIQSGRTADANIVKRNPDPTQVLELKR